MQPNDPPLLVASTDQLGPASEARPLVDRLRTDVLWHQRRGNDTIARDCQEAADEIERMHAGLMAASRQLGAWADAMGKTVDERDRMRAALQALVNALDSGHSLTIFDAWTGAEAVLGPNA